MEEKRRGLTAAASSVGLLGVSVNWQRGGREEKIVDQNSVTLGRVFTWYIGLVLRPVATVRAIIAARPVRAGFLTAAVVLFATAALSFAGFDTESLDDIFEEGAPDFSILAIILFAVPITLFAGVGYVLSTTILHLFSRLFGGNGSWSATLSGLTLFSALGVLPIVPLALASIISFSDGDSPSTAPSSIASLIQLIVTIWTIALIVILARENYRISTGSAVLSVLVSGLAAIFVVGILAILLFLALVIIVLAIFWADTCDVEALRRPIV